MMKFKLLFKKGQNNPSSKTVEVNQNQQVPATSSTVTTATLPQSGNASTARSHFENEKNSKQTKSKQQTSVKKVLNKFDQDKGENLNKNPIKVFKSSQEKIFPKEKTISNTEFYENPLEAIEFAKSNYDNLKKSVNNSTGVSCRSNFDNLSADKTNDSNKVINKSTPCESKSTENLDVLPCDRKEKFNSISRNFNATGEILDTRLGASSHALIGPSEGDLKIMEYQEMKQQLDSVKNEKQMLETKIHELLNYQESLKDELCKMKDLADVNLDPSGAGSRGATSPGGSDTPLRLLPLPSTPPQRHATSAPPSIAPMDALDPPDWDKHSTSSLSEISVACLQDRITQMEETHYCTNEELQATLQELADLQSQLLDLTHANETLGHEKNVLLESLCRQTEKLEDTRHKAETLQELLLASQNDPNLTRLNPSQRDAKLCELLKSSQLDKEQAVRGKDEAMAELTDLRRLSSAMKTDCERLADRVRQLESTLESREADRVQLEQELSSSKQESNSRLIEMSRLSTLLDNARAKIEELEADRDNLRDKSELDELLSQTRKEKDSLESQVAVLQDNVSRVECKCHQQQDTILHLNQEIKVIRNNAKSSLSDMEYERDLNQKEIQRLSHELEVLQEKHNELQVQVQNHLEDKRQLKSLLSETQKQLSETQKQLSETQNTLNVTSKRLSEESNLRSIENEEWQEFQKDLLTTVRVANDFKSETAQKLESVLIENKQLKEKNRSLTSQVDKLKKAEAEISSKPVAPSLPLSSIRTGDTSCSSVLTSVMQRHQFSSQDSRLSVKSLIESIENATKQAKSGPSSSLNSSTSSLNSAGVSGRGSPSPLSPLEDPPHHHTPISYRTSNSSTPGSAKSRGSAMLSSTPDIVHETLKPPPTLKVEEAPTTASSTAAAILESMARRNSQTDLSERKDPLINLVRNGGSRRNALLKWCQTKTLGYHNIDITNFSSSWNDGLALCAILHSYLPDKIPYDELTPNEKRRNFTVAFAAAEAVGIPTLLNTNDMITQERPDWNQVMAYVISIYKHFET